jgi:hypothetical protein
MPTLDDGIDFDGDGDGDGDGDDPGALADLGGGDGDGDGDDSGGSLACMPIVQHLTVTDATPPESVTCVTQVLGDLTVGPTTQLVNLELLSSVREVGGRLTIGGNLALTNVEALAELERVDWLYIHRNRNLGNLHGLDGLVALDRLTIFDNDGMTNLAGLAPNLAPRVIVIADNDLLPSLDGLPVFDAPSGETPLLVEVRDNPSLIDLGGLSGCCAAQPLSLTLARNDALSTLAGLDAFARLDSLRLRDNLGLTSLAGLTNLLELRTLDIEYDRCTSPGANLGDLAGAPNLSALEVLRVESVDSLTSLAGLEGLSTLGELTLRNNAALPWADVLALIEQTQPAIVDACGPGGDACINEPCPMF